MDYPSILIQLDTDRHASVFDAVVAIDSDVDQLLQYSAVDEDSVVGLVHGAMFTRGPAQLSRTAIFVGGSNVSDGQRLVRKIQSTFFGPIRVSVMLDSSGANTTAAAAVLSAALHCQLLNAKAVVLGGTGPVGQRVARLLLNQGAHVGLVSRQIDKAQEACAEIHSVVDANCHDHLLPLASQNQAQLAEQLQQAELVFACGAAGVTLMDPQQLDAAVNLKVAIDLNAVPPVGIASINPSDKSFQRAGRVDYGAIGVGGLKMKIHRAAIRSLFDRNDRILDAQEIFDVGQQMTLLSS